MISHLFGKDRCILCSDRLCIIFLLTCLWMRCFGNDVSATGNATMVRLGRTCYYIENGSKSILPDRYTLNAMGYEYHKLGFVSREYINSLPDSLNPLKTMWDSHSNQKFLALEKSAFILETSKVFSLLNPCFIYWKDSIVVSWRTESESFRIVHIERSKIPTSKNVLTDISYLKTFDFTDVSVPHLSMKGEDPRVVVTTDSTDVAKQRLWVVFCKRYHRSKPELQMSYAELVLVDGKLVSEVTVDINFNNERPREDQKNWSPLAVNGSELLFIAGMDPHRIVGITPTDTQSKVFGKTVSLTQPFANGKLWAYGELRGGTPALLQGDRYLSFFHSSNDPPNAGKDVLKTYAMGAYTFCAQHPHKILSISTQPFVHESMYSGPWPNLPSSYYHIDYIVFPMSYVVDPQEPNSLYLTYGRQDNEGWIAKLDLAKLLSSLHVLNKSCD